MKIEKSKIIFATGGVGKRLPEQLPTMSKLDKNDVMFIDLIEKEKIKLSENNNGGTENEEQ